MSDSQADTAGRCLCRRPPRQAPWTGTGPGSAAIVPVTDGATGLGLALAGCRALRLPLFDSNSDRVLLGLSRWVTVAASASGSDGRDLAGLQFTQILCLNNIVEY